MFLCERETDLSPLTQVYSETTSMNYEPLLWKMSLVNLGGFTTSDTLKGLQ